MKIKPWLILALWDGENGGAGGGAGGAPAGGLAGAAAASGGAGDGKGAGEPGAAGAGDGKGAGEPGASSAYYPENLAESFRGKSDKETIDKLAEHLGKLPQPPKEAKAYEFKPSEKLAPFFTSEGDSKTLDVFRETALKHGLAQGQFEGVINDFYSTMLEQGLIQAPVAIDEEFRKLGGPSGDPATQAAKGQQRALEYAARVDALAANKHISVEHATALKGALNTADQIIAMESLMRLIPGAEGPKAGSAGGRPSGISKADVEARMMAPEYTFNDPKFSRAFYEETNRLWQQVAGT